MSTAVEARQSTELVIGEGQTFWNDAQRAALVQMGLGDAPKGDVEAFFHMAKRSGLDPFARQIYMIERRSKVRGQWVTKYTIQTSIDGFRVIRDRKGTFRGMEEHWCGPDGVWREAWLEDVPPAAARITLYLDGFVKPVTAVARYDEYVPLREGKPTGQWGKMPALMTSKVSEALALRKAYPQDFSGLYTSDEMAQAQNGAQDASAPVPVPAPEPAAAPVEEVVEAEVVEESPVDAQKAAAQERLDAAKAAEQEALSIVERFDGADVDALRGLYVEAREAGLLTVLMQSPEGEQIALGELIQRVAGERKEQDS